MDTELFATLTGFKPASRKHRITDDDFVDRINRYISPILICSFSIMICAKQYVVGEPIQCWTPKEFSDAWEAYSENYCWVSNTYFVRMPEQLPESTDVRKQQEIKYYQWVPFVLAIQAGLFVIPSMIWKALNGRSGMDIKSFVSMAIDATTVEPEKRDESIRMVSRHIKMSLLDNWQNKSSRIGNASHKKSGRTQGIFISSAYIVVKLLYIANIIGQITLLQAFIGTDYKFYGIQILSDLMKGKDWAHSGHFPRVTMCDFDIRALGQTRKYSLQCVLVINIFNEKIYIFLWFWMALIGILTMASLLTWLIWFLLPSWKQETVHKSLDRLGKVSRVDFDDKDDENAPLLSQEDELRHKDNFVNNILHSDGIFMLRMIANNAGEPVVFDIITALWYDLIGRKSLEDEKKKENEADRPGDPPANQNEGTESGTSGTVC